MPPPGTSHNRERSRWERHLAATSRLWSFARSHLEGAPTEAQPLPWSSFRPHGSAGARTGSSSEQAVPERLLAAALVPLDPSEAAQVEHLLQLRLG
jgi:hypothetical protein